MSTVLVTGGSGFVGSYCLIQLLKAGHDVRTTVRSLKREPDVRTMVHAGGAETGERLSFVEADLERDTGWTDAVAGCDYVLHVASPFGGDEPKDEEELVRPAREGTLRVLRAARAAGVRRVVMTSSFAAVGYGHPSQDTPLTEEDWADTTQPDVHAYIKSKAVAERAAWEFMAREGGPMELAVINPNGIFGPVLGPDYSGSIGIIKSLLEGGMPATPRIYFGLTDVRDVADLHLRAMTSRAAAGQRFIAVSGEPMSMHEVAVVLRGRLGEAAKRVPTHELPDAVVRAMALVNPRMRQIAPQLGKRRKASNAKARSLLGWNPRPNEQIIVDTARSLISHGLISRPS